MVRNELSVLSAFLTVAEERSFTRAAKQLNMSTSGLSHAIRRLEEQIGVRLLTRTTRSVSPTDAGEQLIAHLRPALAAISGTLMKLSGLQTKPVGRVRLLCPRLAAKDVLAPKLAQFVRDYPDVELDITTDDSRVDLASAGYDGYSVRGIHRPRHGDCARVAGPPARDRRRTGILQLTPQADISTRPVGTSMHPLPASGPERLEVGTR
jgi:DNA-binding transcriptional LysR family regulator